MIPKFRFSPPLVAVVCSWPADLNEVRNVLLSWTTGPEGCDGGRGVTVGDQRKGTFASVFYKSWRKGVFDVFSTKQPHCKGKGLKIFSTQNLELIAWPYQERLREMSWYPWCHLSGRP